MIAFLIVVGLLTVAVAWYEYKSKHGTIELLRRMK